MSDYNFTDDPSPTLPTQIDTGTNDVVLVDGSPQGDLLSAAFGGTQISVSIQPPSGWILKSQNFSNGGTGTLPVPSAGNEDSYTFSYEVENRSTSEKKSGTGTFKVKKTD